MLATHGIPVAASHPCLDVERAVAVAAEIGDPVALKADFVAPAHASDIDAVMLGLEGESGAEIGWRELERRVQAAGRQWIGAIVQRLVDPGGADVLVGAVAIPTWVQCWRSASAVAGPVSAERLRSACCR